MFTLHSFVEGDWDYWLFTAFIIIAMSGVLLLVRRLWLSSIDNRRIRPYYLLMAALTIVILIAGWYPVQYSGKQEYERTKVMLTSSAPILAYELSVNGYENIQLNTSSSDAVYLRLIREMVDWMERDPQIISFYTLRKLEDGRNVFILGPETDYNRDGLIEGELEARLPIGEAYEERIPELEEAFRGRLTFQSAVTADQWGKTISAYVPIYDSGGRQISVLGLDYDGNLYVKLVSLSRLQTIGLVFAVLVILYSVFAAVAYFVVRRQFNRHKEELRYLAYHDSLTGLPNRSLFRERLSLTISGLPERSYSAAVLYLDIDRFKNLNDSLGHQIGDRLLQCLAQRLAAGLNEDELLARPGGDEYMILLSKVQSQEEVRKKAESILFVLEQPMIVDDYELYVKPSIGASIYPAGGTDADSLIRNADTAMYFAKERSIDYHLYTEDMHEKLLERLSIENDLRKGIERSEFILYYQPKVAARSGEVVGMEALIRWKHPTKGMIPPGRFIPVAEDTGLIESLGEWVLREACRQLKAWSAKGLRPIPVSVNLSSRQFQKKNLVVQIRNTILDFGIDPGWLQLELTESCVMQTPELSNHTMHQLKKSGLSIALDDFGTGYSSFAYLRSFPLDVLKIDKGFVKDVTSNPDNAAIVESLISLAHNLGLRVVCEGVETEAQLDFLIKRNCDEIQGYYYSPPVPPEHAEAWLGSSRGEQGKRLG